MNLFIAAFQKFRGFNELLLTGGLLFLCGTIGLIFQFSAQIVGIALIWSYAKNLEQNFRISMKKANIKYECYTSFISGTLALTFQAFKIMLFEDNSSYEIHDLLILGVSYSFITFMVFIFPTSIDMRNDKENSIQTSYLCVFAVSILVYGQSSILICYLLLSKATVFLYDSQVQEQLPSNSQKIGVIAHILSHKDSRRIFLFLM